MSKVSVIVPVYNAEQYIYGCVKSVLEQTHTDFELILIDDGSNDNSKKICEEICMIDKRIRLVEQEHRGVSAARNAGMDMASGKYIFFLDCDDIIHPQLLEILCRLQENNQTVVATTGFYYAEGDEFRRPVDWDRESDTERESLYLDSDNAKKAFYLTDSAIRLCAIGGKMVSREATTAIRFDESLTHGEDTWFIFQLLVNGADVSVMTHNWYYYRREEKCTGKMYTAAACRSRYVVEKRICKYYIDNARISDAVYMEWDILKGIMLWYEMGRKREDPCLVKCMENLIKEERKQRIYSQIEWYKRIAFRIGCHRYSLYKKMANRMRHMG